MSNYLFNHNYVNWKHLSHLLQTYSFKPGTQVINCSSATLALCTHRYIRLRTISHIDEWVTGLASVFTTLWCSITVGYWSLLPQPLPLRIYSRRNSGWLLVLCSVSSIFWKNESFSCTFHLFHFFLLSAYSILSCVKNLVCSLKCNSSHLWDKNVNSRLFFSLPRAAAQNKHNAVNSRVVSIF